VNGGGKQGPVLTETQMRRQRFAELLAVGVEQSEAARQAGYRGAPRVIKVTASRMARHPDVQAHLAKVRAQAEAAAVLKLEEAKRQLTRMVRFDPRKFIKFVPAKVENAEGELVESKTERVPALDVEQADAAGVLDLIEGFEITEKGTLRVKFPDRLAALDRLGKLEGWNAPEKVALSGKVETPGGEFPPGFLEYVKKKMEGGAA
jgi:hypothetical protein